MDRLRYIVASMKPPVFTRIFETAVAGLKATTVLNNGVPMPWLGLGVFQMPGDAATAAAVQAAIAQGYRSIDTAALYHNERGVGQAIRACGVPRAELFITTKVWNDEMRSNRVEAAFEQSSRKRNRAPAGAA